MYEKEWLYSWIRNSAAMIESGDSLAVKVFEENNKVPMLPFEDLSNEDIDAILAFIANPPAKEEAPKRELEEGESPVAQQVQVWSDESKGANIFTLGPLMILSVVLIVMVLISQKIPGL